MISRCVCSCSGLKFADIHGLPLMCAGNVAALNLGKELQNQLGQGGTKWSRNQLQISIDLEESHFAMFQSRQSGIPIFHEPQGVRSQIS